MNKVSYVIGDIHGCWHELLALEEKIDRHSQENGWQPLKVCVGDLVDRGPDAAKVVEHFRLGLSKGTHAVVMGNHESELLRQLYGASPGRFAAAGVSLPPYLFSLEDDFALGRRGSSLFSTFEDFRAMMGDLWLRQGGWETLASYGCHEQDPADWDIGAEHLRFLSGLPLIWRDDQVVVSHGLLHPSAYEVLGGAGEEETARIAPQLPTLEVREAAFTALWSRSPPAARVDPKRLHVSGHTPLKGAFMARELGYLQIDTGCVYGRRLTAYCAETDEFLDEVSHTAWEH